MNPEPWVRFGACVGEDPDIFFPARDEDTRKAKAVCAGCEVKVQCLEYALANERCGIWGGVSERERRKLRRQRALERRKKQVA